MEDEDDMSDVYAHQRSEHSLPPYQEFDEFGDPELLRCLHTAGEMMKEMMPVTETMMVREAAEMMPVTEMKTETEAAATVKEVEISDAMMDTETGKIMDEEPLNDAVAVEPAATGEGRNEEAVPEAWAEVVKEASLTVVAEDTGAEVRMSEAEVTKETADTEAEELVKEMAETDGEELVEVTQETADMEAEELMKEMTEMEAEELVEPTEETAETKAEELVEVARETAEMDAEELVEVTKETPEMGAEELAKDTVEMKEEELTKEMTEMEVAADVVREGLETEVSVKEASESEVPVKEASESEVPVEALRPKRGNGKRKRGRALARVQSRAPPKKKEEEDVCFICFDGGNLVLCDRRYVVFS